MPTYSITPSAHPVKCPPLPWQVPDLRFFFLKIYLFIYDRERKREREAETQEEGEAGSMLGAPRGTRSRDSALVSPGSKAGAKPLSHPGIPPN